MPELPEVETVARQLAPLAVGRRIERVEIIDRAKLDGPGLAAGVAAAPGRRIAAIERLGKEIILTLAAPNKLAAPNELAAPEEQSAEEEVAMEEVPVAAPGAATEPPAPCAAPLPDPLYLAVHLRMTGRLTYDEAARPAAAPLRARLVLAGGGFIHFCDTRRFGTFRLLRSVEALAPRGIDPVGAAFSVAALAGRLAGSPQALKPWLLRQDRLVGLGNIYASEILWRAGLSPHRPAGSLTPGEIARLYEATVAVLRLAIECGGTTIDDYRNAQGGEGRFQHRLNVYGRAGRPCPRCARPVERCVQQGRSTFYCPHCQR